jgi:hypothetical protein
MMTYTIISGVFLTVLLLIKSKRHKPFISNKPLHTSFLVLSLLLILSGVTRLVYLLFSNGTLAQADIALSLFLTGIAITGFIAETSTDPNDRP